MTDKTTIDQKAPRLDFTADTEKDAKTNFIKELGGECKWFAELLYSIKSDWIDKGCQITEILIRENMPVYVAVVKSYFPYQPTDGNRYVPSGNDLKAILLKFTKRTPAQLPGRIADFSFSVMGLGIFRCNYSEGMSGISYSIRYLTHTLPLIDNIGYPDFYTRYVKNLVSQSTILTPGGTKKISTLSTGGMILHVGATGSGKTTSIAAELAYYAETITGAIVTYEDPIEYRYVATKAPVRQYEIGQDIVKSSGEPVSENIQRHILRSNPSVVMIGEARDNQAIKAAIDVAARGHLVFLTIHASNVKEALTTLMAVTKEEPYLLANTLKAIVAHKLVTGESGKIVPLMEIMIPEATIRENIVKQSIKEIENQFYREKTVKEGQQTFLKSLQRSVVEGKLKPAEADEIKRSNLGIFAEG